MCLLATSRKSEIGELDMATAIKENVIWFYITIWDLLEASRKDVDQTPGNIEKR